MILDSVHGEQSLRFCLLLLIAGIAAAHDIPRDATVQAFLRPSGQKLQMIVRAPLGVIRDIAFPEDEHGYLRLEALQLLLPNAAASQIGSLFEMYEQDQRLEAPRVSATQVSLESDRSFTSFDAALAHVNGPKLRSEDNVVWNQVYLDILFEYTIQSDRSLFSIRPGFERLAANVVTVVRFLGREGEVRAYEFQGDPGVVPLDPGWFQAARRFVEFGFFHILGGVDHLLFLLCLVLPFRSFRPLVIVVTAFTVAHSITLIASAFGLAPDRLWFPPLMEALIAASIVYMALENIIGTGTQRRRWIMAFVFGLVHGFGFSFALRDTLQFAGSHLLSSLVAFNVGVEIGQGLVVLVFIGALELLFRYAVPERIGAIIISALVAHTGWHWMIERFDRLRLFR
jgi:hypothetical protein